MAGNNASRNTPGVREQWAVRALFFVGGFGSASWAPLVPYLKARLAIGDDVLGMLLLCVGIGSLVTMPVSGTAAERFGCRRVLLTAGTLFAMMLLGLSVVDVLPLAVVLLLLFGASMGAIDTVVNIAAAIIAAVMLVARSGLLPYGGGGGGALIAIPRGIVAFIGAIACIAFLVEGAVMDWGGVFLTTVRGMDMAMAGTGFAIFSAAMLVMRLTGDAIVSRLGQRAVVLGGTLCTMLGFLGVIYLPGAAMYLGFFAIGVGAANVVPVFYSLLGRQDVMPLSTAVPAVSTLGYLGVLMGPAAIGFLAHAIGIADAFLFLALLVAVEMGIAAYVFRSVKA